VHPATGASATIFAGINATGIWRRPLSEIAVSVSRTMNEVPRGFILGQNYPNPFNPATTIGFSLPRACFVKLEVFNVLGERIATLVSQEMLAGTHQIQWDAAGVGSGVYMYRLMSGSFAQAKQMVVLK
jgi:hypothetical protein